MPPAPRLLNALSAAPDIVVAAPGRINVIGEHTDYNGGLVLPAAIDKRLYYAARRIQASEWRLTAVDIGQSATLPLPVGAPTDKQWVNYLAGIGREFQLLGYELPGLEIAVGGDLPAGAGMSSSAALEGGLAFLLNEILGAGLSGPELARLCQRSSNNFMGIPSGIMDQFASLNGSEQGPILLNCNTLEFHQVNNRLTDHTFLLVNSMVTHDLAHSEYPTRVRQCNAALAALRKHQPRLPALSAAKETDLTMIADQVDPVILRRARYVVQEDARVRAMVQALESADAPAAIRLLNATHAGLRDDYEVSCPEIDFLQQQAATVFPGGPVGARIMGGGFGGCTINLVPTVAVDGFTDFIVKAYQEAYGTTADVYPIRLAAGTL